MFYEFNISKLLVQMINGYFLVGVTFPNWCDRFSALSKFAIVAVYMLLFFKRRK